MKKLLEERLKKHNEQLENSARREQAGITIIALVITIVVLLILVGISISMLSGDNSILTRASSAATKTEIAGVEEQAQMIYLDLIAKKYTETSGGNATLADVANELNAKGYTVISVASSEDVITGISLDNSLISISANGSATIKVTYEGNSNGSTYYVAIKGQYYKMKENAGGISIERTATEFDNSESGDTLTATVTSGSSVTIGSINGNVITINGGSTGGSSVVTISYGEFSKTCTVSVLVTPTDSSVASETTPTFSTDYGLVDIVWLSEGTNTVTTIPNEPNLYTGSANAMTPVSWTYDTTNNKWVEDTTTKTKWYNYTSGTGTDDNTASMWANAKNSDNSYFVWIPRYAYRITYYSDSAYTNVTGCYDGWGMWNAIDGTLNYKIDGGIETIEYNGNKYIVHPAFMQDTNKKDSEGNDLADYDRGGWESNLTGFWVAKYEMSRTGASETSVGSGTTFYSLPNKQSARSIKIGDMYTYSLAYDADKESHLMKNSEWGAVAYLTQSTYGRNGHEIDINNSSSYITGNGGGAVGGSVSYTSEVANYYDTATGAKASSTGNVYGIYDLSGGAWEYVAGYDKLGSSDYIAGSSYGLNMTQNAKDADGNYISTKYITAYSNGTSDYSSTSLLYSLGKIGDATKEVRKKSNSNNWFGDSSYFVYSHGPFFRRGGSYNNGSGAGAFSSHRNDGNYNGYYSFRVVLAQ